VTEFSTKDQNRIIRWSTKFKMDSKQRKEIEDKISDLEYEREEQREMIVLELERNMGVDKETDAMKYYEKFKELDEEIKELVASLENG